MRLGKPSKKDGIRRFPRLERDYPNSCLEIAPRMTKIEKVKLRISKGDIPRGWTRITKKQRRIIKKVVGGMSVRDACELEHVDKNTYYIWLNCHPLFQRCYYALAKKRAGLVEDRLDSKLPRAVQIMEESLDSRDPYFAHDAAVTLLKGRGKLKQATVTKQEVTGSVRIGTRTDIHHHVDKDVALAFVDAMVRMSQAGKVIKPDVIDVEVLKKLPPPKVVRNASAEVQEDNEAKAVRKD